MSAINSVPRPATYRQTTSSRIIYPDGREVCLKNNAGRQLYRSRTETAARRQNMVCCICHDPQNLMSLAPGFGFSATFEHDQGRGLGGGHRDDRIWDENGEPMNGAAHLNCNLQKGSRRKYV